MDENDDSSNAVNDKDSPVPKETRIKLQPFFGNARDWKDWWYNFDRAVHSNAELSVSEKLQYFCDALAGSAKGFQKKFIRVPENYDSIIRAFQNRYFNLDQLVLGYYQALEKIPAAGTSLFEQQCILDRFLSTIANLRAIGHVSSDDRLDSYSYLVMSKFPTSTLMHAFTEAQFMQSQTSFANGSNAQTCDLASQHLSLPVDTLLEAIRRVLRKFEYITKIKGQSSKMIPLDEVGSNSSGNNDANNDVGQKSGVKRGIQETQECLFCLRKGHESIDCLIYPTVNARKKLMKKVGLCSKCLNEGHSSGSCLNSQENCIKCGQVQHHVAICRK